jgi:hypothetical protein
MRFFALAAAAALAGCAAQQPTAPEIYKWSLQATDYQICRAVILGQGNVQRIAGHEQQARRLDCAPYSQAVIAEANGRSQADAAALANTMLLIQASQPVFVPAPISPPVSCVSRPSAGTVVTSCN